MNSLVRTTITLPNDLFERLKTTAFYQKKTISALIREGASLVVDYKKSTYGKGITRLVGKYNTKGKKGEFIRRDFYDKFIRAKMSS